MKVRYFSDTYTALVEFVNRKIFETREINENIYVELDEEGNLVSMTIERARANAGLREFSYQEVTA